MYALCICSHKLLKVNIFSSLPGFCLEWSWQKTSCPSRPDLIPHVQEFCGHILAFICQHSDKIYHPSPEKISLGLFSSFQIELGPTCLTLYVIRRWDVRASLIQWVVHRSKLPESTSSNTEETNKRIAHAARFTYAVATDCSYAQLAFSLCHSRRSRLTSTDDSVEHPA